MSTPYPNQYYAELAELVIKNPSLTLKPGEVCFYEGKAKSYQTVTSVETKPQIKDLFFYHPLVCWFKAQKRGCCCRKDKHRIFQRDIFHYEYAPCVQVSGRCF